jgi:ABC-type transport system substrate-binding protein
LDKNLTPVPKEVLQRRQFLRGMAATGAAAGAAGLLAACGGSSSPASATPGGKPKYGGNLSVGMSGGSSSDTLDPNQGLTEVDTGRAECLYEPLVKLDKDAKKFMDSLDAYSDRLRGYSTAKVGESLSNWAFRQFWFAS